MTTSKKLYKYINDRNDQQKVFWIQADKTEDLFSMKLLLFQTQWFTASMKQYYHVLVHKSPGFTIILIMNNFNKKCF